jgi:hypothetical protein
MVWLFVTFDSNWIDEAGSGEACVSCGDDCWLTQSRLEVTLNGERVQLDGPDIILCAACVDVLRQVEEF